MTDKNKKQNTGGVAPLNVETERLRQEVIVMEYKARYWKAQFEIQNYTLQCESLKPEYDKFLVQEQARQKENYEQMMAQLGATTEAQAEEGVVENLQEV